LPDAIAEKEALLVKDRLSQNSDPKKAPGAKKNEDLFSAHDFDIKIDLEVPLSSKYLVLSLFIHRSS
jgi:hypothetical protein